MDLIEQKYNEFIQLDAEYENLKDRHYSRLVEEGFEKQHYSHWPKKLQEEIFTSTRNWNKQHAECIKELYSLLGDKVYKLSDGKYLLFDTEGGLDVREPWHDSP